MKNKLFKLIIMILALIFTLSATLACGGDKDTGITEKVDPKRTQLYVYNYNGGFGSEWLKKIKLRFEAEYADTSFTAGKMGVQIMPDNQKSGNTTLESTIKSSADEVFFVELAQMQSLINKGLLLDITDAVTGKMTKFGEDKSIADKMDASQKDYMSKDGKFYCIPHYEGFWGMSYNVDLFNQNLLYFSNISDNGNQGFIINENDKRSNGADGKENTYDDGLPSTYDEFYTLCDRMKNAMDISPIGWMGKTGLYVNNCIVSSLWADYEGAAQTKLNYSFDGVAKNIVTGFNGETPIVEETTIDNSNGYLTYRQAGKYYGLSFLEKIIDNKWYDSNAFSNAQSNLSAQADFLYSNLVAGEEKIGILADGCWWQMEAASVFKETSQLYPNADEYSRNFGWLPLPKATKLNIGEKPALVDSLWSSCFINSNIAPEKIELAKLFLQFCNTDISLAEFNITTNTTKGLSYTLSEEQYAKLTPYGKSLYNARQNSDIMRPYSMNTIFKNNSGSFFWGDQLSSTTPKGTFNVVRNAMRDSGVSAKEYFEGIGVFYSQKYWNDKYSNFFKI